MYDFKWFEETAWFAIVAAITYIAGVAVVGMPSDHWKVWAMTLVAGASRAAVAVVVSRVKAAPPVTPSHSSAVSVTTATTALGSAITASASTYTTEPIVTVTPPLAETLPDHAGTLPRAQAVAPTSVSPTV